MKKDKNKKIFKNKYALLIIVVLIAFAVAGVNQILGLEINENTRVCEDKKGNLFVPRDKNGKKDECGKHGDAVTFNFGGGTGSGGGSIKGTGDIAFVAGDYVLKNNGKVLNHRFTGNNMDINYGYEWEQDLISLPDGLTADMILQWTSGSFLTKDGVYYVLIGYSFRPFALPAP